MNDELMKTYDVTDISGNNLECGWKGPTSFPPLNHFGAHTLTFDKAFRGCKYFHG